MKDLDARLLTAHATGDPARLSQLYTEAADVAPTEDAEGFYLTHAHIFALEAGLKTAPELRARLIAMGRETPL